MSDEGTALRAWRAHELLGSVPIALWAGFHLWEQWAAFGGRDLWLERMARTSHGALALAVELALAILPALAWVALELRLRAQRSEPEALRFALAEDREAARRLGLLARVGSWVFFGWLLYHAAWLWLPKLSANEPLLAWVALRDRLGTWPHAIAHAIGLTAMTVHLSAAAPRLAIALGWVSSPEGRRAARLSGLIVALGLLFLYAQLAGWHAAGRGTLWSL